jgi:hypothetical protein
VLPSILDKGYKLFSDSEIDYLKDNIYKRGSKYEDYPGGKDILTSYYYTWKFYNADFLDIRNILEPKIKSVTDIDLIFDHSHILHSMIPYNLHTDFYQKNMLNNAKIKPAYTIIIPLDDFKTSTFVFNQSDEDKELSNLDRTKVLEDCVNNETRKNYLSHIKDTELDYLSVKEQFHWTKGSLHACDRRYIHCSDNYNLDFKNAIIFWTSMKNV